MESSAKDPTDRLALNLCPVKSFFLKVEMLLKDLPLSEWLNSRVEASEIIELLCGRKSISLFQLPEKEASPWTNGLNTRKDRKKHRNKTLFALIFKTTSSFLLK